MNLVVAGVKNIMSTREKHFNGIADSVDHKKARHTYLREYISNQFRRANRQGDGANE